MIKVILATSNPNKLREINAINTDLDIVFEVIQGDFDPIEDGKDFLENATIKAREAAKITNTYCLADDSGLCVDFLNGAPGIYSARYANTPKERIARILKELKDVPDSKRNAHFNCTMVLTDKDGKVMHFEEGKIEGKIAYEPKGEHGFGYDPVFYLEEYGKTISELPDEVKNSISHRANALKPMLKWISNNLKS